jgi:hypothetical protein
MTACPCLRNNDLLPSLAVDSPAENAKKRQIDTAVKNTSPRTSGLFSLIFCS